MPIYEYRCSACGHELEALQKLSEARLVNCPACHADTLVKKVSAAGFQLKGSGWYVTDFRNGNKGAAKPKSDAPANGDAAKADAPVADAKNGTPAATESSTKAETPAPAAKPAESKKTESAPVKPASTPAAGNTST
jgi:putative FmdB family regulatory protein